MRHVSDGIEFGASTRSTNSKPRYHFVRIEEQLKLAYGSFKWIESRGSNVRTSSNTRDDFYTWRLRITSEMLSIYHIISGNLLAIVEVLIYSNDRRLQRRWYIRDDLEVVVLVEFEDSYATWNGLVQKRRLNHKYTIVVGRKLIE